MNRPNTFDELTESIRRVFRPVQPNGWLLGWDPNRHFGLVSAVVAPHQTTNHTSFDYGFCNWFEVRVDVDQPEAFFTLTIKLSFIIPAYCIHWTQYDSPRHGMVISAAPAGYDQLEDNVRIALVGAGFFELPSEWEKQEINRIRLELSGTENVTIGKCLFSDFEG